MVGMLSKKEQLSKKRQKPKPSMKNKSKITEHEREYLSWLQNQKETCFVCGTDKNIEYHHVKNKSTDIKQHDRLIPLCIQHHRLSNVLSPHNAPKEWRNTFTLDEQLKHAKAIYERFLNETN